ncbi:hypothetical protein [Streptomyces chrestomyceticus]|uniref:hypothetical protein n=1 Tax=Streptomyces chrestomyceticus TaxID=68185 RepID=UPI0033EE5597
MPSPPALTAPAGSTITVRLPADFTAFCQLHHPTYLHYTHLRVTCAPQAERLVEAALGDLATIWPQALASPNTPAAAWHLLTTRVNQLQRTTPAPRSDPLHTLLPHPEADAALLCGIIGLTPTHSADITGSTPATVTGLLTAFHRRLTTPTGTQLRARWHHLNTHPLRRRTPTVCPS